MEYFARADNTVTAMETRHQKLVESAALEGFVLLENEDVLPLDKKEAALYGSGAENTVYGGSGSGDVNARSCVSILDALKAKGWTIYGESWIRRNREAETAARNSYMEKIERIAAERKVPAESVMLQEHYKEPEDVLIQDDELYNCTAAVYVIRRKSGEGEDRKPVKGDWYLSDTEKANIRTIRNHYQKVVILLNIGGMIDLSFLEEKGTSDIAVVQIGLPGQTGCLAAADLLSGAGYPSGHLTDTWPNRLEEAPSRNSEDTIEDAYYSEGVFTGYRWYDSFNIPVRYSFGYGLSYTSFTTEVLNAALKKTICSVQVKVKNSGNRVGKCVLQLYHGFPETEKKEPRRVLAAFAKSGELKPGEEEILQLSFDTEDLAIFDADKKAWVIQAGVYPLYLGESLQQAEPLCGLKAETDIILKKYDDLPEQTVDLKEPECTQIHMEGLNMLTLKEEYYHLQKVHYTDHNPLFPGQTENRTITMEDVQNGRNSMEQMVSQLSDEEMAEMCVGASCDDALRLVGGSSALVPGASGDTSAVLKEKRHVRNLIMADGPAGLRLKEKFYTDKNGKLLAEDHAEKAERTYYQWCTFFPAASLLAASWNTNLIESIGQAVGEEMKEYGISLWLAPAMNLHRDPLGGRNFEYYSEDPLLSGKCAAACVKGVQSTAGCGAVLKHFAVNNREDGRMYMNVHVSEKTLREVYLKNFEMVIKEAEPAGVMSAYNEINGTPCANSRYLLQNILREEFGFQGIVMTDWFATVDIRPMMGMPKGKYDGSDGAKCITAGNDLQMPGNPMLVNEIVKGRQNETIRKEDLQACTLHILKAIERLKR